MKIAFLMHSFYEIDIGGAEYQAYMIAKHLSKAGYDVNFVFLKHRNQLCKNINRFSLFPITKLRYKKLIPLKLMYCFQVIRALNRIKPDIIYHRDFSSFLFCAHLYRLIFNSKTKIVFHVAHDNDTQKNRLVLKPSQLLNTLDNLVGKPSISITRNIIVQTYHQKKQILENYHCNSTLIRNFGESPAPIQLLKKENIIIWIGNVKKIKNPFDFFELANELKETNYRFIMVGKPPTGKFKAKFDTKLKQSNVEYLGQVSNETVNRLLTRSKLLCCTSFAEGFSNTFIQAWFRKVPVVSLHVDPDGLIIAHNLGRHSKTFSQFKQDVVTLIGDEVRLEEMARRVHRFAIDRFSVDNNISRLIIYLNQLL